MGLQTIEQAVKPPPFLDLKDDGSYSLHFHTGQARVWNSDARWVAMISGTQVGKTEFGPHWLRREIQHRTPSETTADYLAVSPTFPLMNLKMKPAFLRVFEGLHGMGTWREADKIFVSHEKTKGGEPAWRVLFGSADRPESLEAATARAAWLDEAGQDAFRLASWEAILRRLSIHQGRVLITTTPYNLGWLKREVVDKWKDGADYIDVITVDSLENPAFPRDEYERAMASLPTWKFRMFYQGQFDRPAGIIYASFDESVHLVKRFTIPKEWPRYVGHDFGQNNTAALWFAQDPATANLYLYREYHAGGESLDPAAHARKFLKLSEGENVVMCVGGSHQEMGWRAAFKYAGWDIQEPKEHEVEVGLTLVDGWHRQNRLFVFRGMNKYLDEKMSYSRELDGEFLPTEKIANKSRYHLMDAERYLLSSFAPERVQRKIMTGPIRYPNFS